MQLLREFFNIISLERINSCKKQSFNLCVKVAATKVLRGMIGSRWQYFAQRASVKVYTSGIFRGASINWKPVNAKKIS